MSEITYDERHGGAYDRGRADSWYCRPFNPHYFVDGSYNSPKVEAKDMTVAEHAAYYAGFYDNEATGQHKDFE